MQYVILGLLLIRPHTLYDLLKSFEAVVSLFYSASAGSIKTALNRLLKEGHISVRPVQGDARGRKLYSVTESGTERFEAWMNSPISDFDFEVAALSRLFFLGLCTPQTRQVAVANIRARLSTDLHNLEQTGREIDARDVPAELAEVARFQRAALDYGIQSYQLADAFYARLERDLQQ